MPKPRPMQVDPNLPIRREASRFGVLPPDIVPRLESATDAAIRSGTRTFHKCPLLSVMQPSALWFRKT